MNTVYLDNSSTTPVVSKVVEEMIPYFMNEFGNPSSIHSLGLNAKSAIENSRFKISRILNCDKNEIYFTSSATESNNWALKSIASLNKRKGNHIITTCIEHGSILNTCLFLESKGFKITYLPVDKYGLISLDDLKKSITKETILISIMYANNEIGTVQPVEEIAKIAKEKNIYFHTDAVQVVGKLDIDISKLNIDMLSLSGHKIYGPKGIGILYINKNINIKNFIHGGYQERGVRGGTENVPGCVGISKALELSLEITNLERIKFLRKMLIDSIQLKIPCSKINGHPEKHIPHIINISFPEVNGKLLTSELNKYGIYVSNGSACNCIFSKPSHVLLELGIPKKLAMESIRLSLGNYTTQDDINYCVDKISFLVDKIRNY